MPARNYDGKNVRVTFDARRCIHAAECVNGLPSVFDPKAKPWIQPDGASAEDIVRVVHRCPTGALHAETLDGEALESAVARNAVVVRADGPVYVRGQIRVLDGDGNVTHEDTRVALCRCGVSKNKPFCDNSHVQAAFRDAGDVARPLEAAEVDAGPVDITVLPDGPALLSGAHVVINAEDTPSPVQKRSALCRCGASKDKPFCDGSHKAAGFTG